jgi:hypothetical protein
MKTIRPTKRATKMKIIKPQVPKMTGLKVKVPRA